MLKKLQNLLIFFCFFIPAFPLAAQPSDTLYSTSMILQWTPQSQFAGYYAALDQGYYEKHGVEMTILRGGPDRDQVKSLKSGEAEFATFFLTGALTFMDEGLDMVHLGQVINKSNLVLVCWKKRGIDKIYDLRDKRISAWGKDFSAPYLSLFESKGFLPEIIPQYYSVSVFLHGGVDGCTAMYYNEYHRIYQSGIDLEDLTVFSLADFGVHVPEDGIYCVKDIYNSNKDYCEAVFAASMEGWDFVRQHPEEALDIVMRYVVEDHVPTNRTHMQWMIDVILPTIYPGENDNWQTGKLSRDDYEYTSELLIKYNIISEAPSFEEFKGGMTE